jgi:hypothetical protein
MTISNRFVLVGPHAGQTQNLGGHDFVDGVYEFLYHVEGIASMPSQDDIKLKAVSLARNYQAFPEGSPELDAAAAALKAGTDTHPGTSTPEERENKEQDDRSERTVSSRKTAGATRTALTKLDPKNDGHWTDDGLPAVAAVREIAGVETISRADIVALAPNLNREEAAKLNADEKND